MTEEYKYTEYDRRAERWVKKYFPDAQPVLGSIEFQNDCAGYASGGWADVQVSWVNDDGSMHTEDLPYPDLGYDPGWKFDWTRVIRELVDMDPDPTMSEEDK